MEKTAEERDQELAEESLDDVEDTEETPASETEVARVTEELKKKSEQLLRLAADFDNFKKRQRRETDREKNSVKDGVFLKLLPILDSMDRAAESVRDGDDLEHLRQGLEQIHKQFLTALSDLGVAPMEAVGKVFDPHYHEAMMHMPAEGAEPGDVTAELQRGWMINERVLRPARVGVAPEKPHPAEEESVDDDHCDGCDDTVDADAGSDDSGADDFDGFTEDDTPYDEGDEDFEGSEDE